MIKVELRQDAGSYTPVTFTFDCIDEAIYFINNIEQYMDAGMCLTMTFEKEGETSDD